MENLEQRAERKTNLFSYRNGYSTAKDAYIEGYKDCQSTFDNLPKIKAWITRDRNRNIVLYPFWKPKKYNSVWDNNKIYYVLTKTQLPEGCNPKWEDDEPIEVELTIQMKGGTK